MNLSDDERRALESRVVPDHFLKFLAEEAGFAGFPTVVPEIQSPMFRGVEQVAHAEQFVSGEYWPGQRGLLGTGTYAVQMEQKNKAMQHAGTFAGEDGRVIVLDLSIQSDTVLKQYDEVRASRDSDRRKLQACFHSLLESGEKANTQDLQNRLNAAEALYANLGRYMISQRIDALQRKFNGKPIFGSYFLIVNRTKVLVKSL